MLFGARGGKDTINAFAAHVGWKKARTRDANRQVPEAFPAYRTLLKMRPRTRVTTAAEAAGATTGEMSTTVGGGRGGDEGGGEGGGDNLALAREGNNIPSDETRGAGTRITTMASSTSGEERGRGMEADAGPAEAVGVGDSHRLDEAPQQELANSGFGSGPCNITPIATGLPTRTLHPREGWVAVSLPGRARDPRFQTRRRRRRGRRCERRRRRLQRPHWQHGR